MHSFVRKKPKTKQNTNQYVHSIVNNNIFTTVRGRHEWVIISVFFLFVGVRYRNQIAIRRTERPDRMQTVRGRRIVHRRSDGQYRVVAGRIAIRIDVHLEAVECHQRFEPRQSINTHTHESASNRRQTHNSPHCTRIAAALDGIDDGGAVARIAARIQHTDEGFRIQMHRIVQISGFRADLRKCGVRY